MPVYANMHVYKNFANNSAMYYTEKKKEKKNNCLINVFPSNSGSVYSDRID
jgi:hypothetical protein